MMNYKTKLALMFSTLFALFSCASNTSKPVSGLENGVWVLVSTNAQAMQAQKAPTLKFKQGMVEGFGGCNTFRVAYTLEKENKLSFGMIAATKKLCSKFETSESENQYFAALRQVQSYRLEGDRLILEGTGNALSFTRK